MALCHVCHVTTPLATCRRVKCHAATMEQARALHPRLLVFGPSWGAPSLDAACTKAYAYLLFCGLREDVDFTVDGCLSPRRSLGGEYPILELANGQLAEGPHEVCATLAKNGMDADATLSPAQRAESAAYSALIEERLGLALLHSWWEDETNYDQVVRPALAAALPIPLCYYLPWAMRKRVHSQLARRRCTSPDVAYALGEAALEALSERLGTSAFFHGDKPTTVDSSAFGYLSAVMRCPLPHDRLRSALRDRQNLVDFCQRIDTQYFGGSAPLMPKPNPAPSSAPRLTGIDAVIADHEAETAAAAEAAASGAEGGGRPAKEKRTTKQQNFRRRSRNAVLGATGAALIYALAVDALGWQRDGQEEGDEQE